MTWKAENPGQCPTKRPDDFRVISRDQSRTNDGDSFIPTERSFKPTNGASLRSGFVGRNQEILGRARITAMPGDTKINRGSVAVIRTKDYVDAIRQQGLHLFPLVVLFTVVNHNYP
ncbi:hypothetical protein GCM10027038_09180 [Arthrobacter bambusae]